MAMRVEGVIAASIGAVFSAMAYTSVRYVTKLDPSVPAMVHVFYFGLVSTCACALWLWLQPPVMPPDALGWLALLCVGFLAFFGQILLNRGLQLAPAGTHTLYWAV